MDRGRIPRLSHWLAKSQNEKTPVLRRAFLSALRTKAQVQELGRSVIIVNCLLTKTIKGKISPTAESQLMNKGHGNEEERPSPRLLGMAARWWLVRRRIPRIRILPSEFFG